MDSSSGRGSTSPPHIATKSSSSNASLVRKETEKRELAQMDTENDLIDDTESFCRYCKTICDLWFSAPSPLNPDSPLEHHGSLEELNASAHSCSMCAQFAITVYPDNLYSLRDNFWVASGPRTGMQDGAQMFGNPGGSFQSMSDSELIYGLAIFKPGSRCRDSDADLIKLFIPKRPIPDFQGCRVIETVFIESSIEVSLCESPHSLTCRRSQAPSTGDGLPSAKFWSEQCVRDHLLCHDVAGPKFVPTRLVDLSREPPCLHITSKEDLPITYTTLSHCWGTTQRPVLTKELLPIWLHQIPPEAISSTFSDAMYICKYLGLRYIWIDSLCIIQDDNEDWIRESASMSNVYSKSFLNISASAARDGSDGCFIARENSWLCKIKCNTPTVAERIVMPYDFEKSFLDSLPLMQRGWALQERLLAPRTLHCAGSQLFWECNEQHACEAFPSGYENGWNSWRTKLNPSDNIYDAIRSWEEITRAYSHCDLSKVTDTLVAISGLAQATATLSPVLGLYVAGMWKNHLEHQLSWSIEHEPVKRQGASGAPTWSWASVGGQKVAHSVHWRTNGPLEREAPSVTVQDVVVKYKNPENPFGDVESAILALGCKHMLHCTAVVFKVFGYRVKFSFRGTTMYAKFDSLEEKQQAVEAASPDIFLVPVIMIPGWPFEGLLLRSVRDMKGRYKRVGYFHSNRLFDDSSADVFKISAFEQDQVNDGAYASITTNSDGEVLKIIHII